MEEEDRDGSPSSPPPPRSVSVTQRRGVFILSQGRRRRQPEIEEVLRVSLSLAISERGKRSLTDAKHARACPVTSLSLRHTRARAQQHSQHHIAARVCVEGRGEGRGRNHTTYIKKSQVNIKNKYL